MATRKFHGINAAHYQGNGGTSFTEISNVVSSESEIVFPDQPDDQTNEIGGIYYARQYTEVTIVALDLTAHAAIAGDYEADNKVAIKVDLDNAETWTTTDDSVLFQQLKQIDIQGTAEGRADGFVMQFRYADDDWTKA